MKLSSHCLWIIYSKFTSSIRSAGGGDVLLPNWKQGVLFSKAPQRCKVECAMAPWSARGNWNPNFYVLSVSVSIPEQFFKSKLQMYNFHQKTQGRSEERRGEERERKREGRQGGEGERWRGDFEIAFLKINASHACGAVYVSRLYTCTCHIWWWKNTK